MDLKGEINEILSDAISRSYPDLKIKAEDAAVEKPESPEHGDLASSVALKIANELGEKAGVVAEKIVREVKTSELVEKVAIDGPGFINFWIGGKALIANLKEIDTKGKEYGSSELGKGQTVVIDYSAPNIAKRFGIGHLRSTIIGQALYNLLKFQGYKVIGDNHLGDWGTQFGKLLYMISERGTKEFSLDDLEKWYVEFHQRAESEPLLEEQGRKWFKKLEEGDKTARELWKKCVEISMEEFKRIYEILGVKLDCAYGESFYESMMPQVISEAKEKKIARESEGAMIIEIPGVKAPLILVKNDGATTYATRDLATLKFRQKEWQPDMVIYEVGAEQALHFVQVFAAARMLGYVSSEEKLVHTKHGLYRWEHGKMKTREGSAVKLEDILDEAIQRAKKMGDPSVAQEVGVGAIKYFDLSHQIQSDIIFDWEKMFSMEGNSGPYLQYTHARARSVLRKNHTAIFNFQFSIYNKFSIEETNILRTLIFFPEVIKEAAQGFSPNLVANYLFDLAKKFNGFYNKLPILGNPLRLAITSATATVLSNGLNLLGITPLEKM